MKKTKLAIVLGLLCSGALVGCGGDENQSAVEDGTVSYQVTAIDGYLKNAFVWLDLDGDYEYDEGVEPGEATGDDGTANLDVTDIENPQNYRVLVKAIAGETVDIGDDINNPENVVVEEEYLMSAPPSADDGASEAVVTPLTTLVDIYLEQYDVEPTDDDYADYVDVVVNDVADDLGLEADSILDDFIESDDAASLFAAEQIVDSGILPDDEEQIVEYVSEVAEDDPADTTDDSQFLTVIALASDVISEKIEEVQTAAEAEGAEASFDDVTIEEFSDADKLTTDTDGDGYVDAFDAFPEDRGEWIDTDGDGIGNNADDNDDGDDKLDVDDAFPLDASEDTDTDGDKIGDNSDFDIDGDEVKNEADAFPFDPTEDTDTDGDGTGNNADDDDDGDDTLDVDDDFPLDKTEDTDTDGDGIGNNADTDDDNDTILDSVDVYPTDSTRAGDPDEDGVDSVDDQYPDDGTKAGDSDGDGVDDLDDYYPDDSTQWERDFYVCNDYDTGELSGDDVDTLTYTSYLSNATSCGYMQVTTAEVTGLTLYNERGTYEYRAYVFEADGEGYYDRNGRPDRAKDFTWSVNDDGVIAIEFVDSEEVMYIAVVSVSAEYYSIIYLNKWIDTEWSDAEGDDIEVAYGEINGGVLTSSLSDGFVRADNVEAAVNIVKQSGTMYEYWAEDSKLYQAEFSVSDDTLSFSDEKRIMTDGSLVSVDFDDDDLLLTSDGWVYETNIIIDMSGSSLVGYRVVLVDGQEKTLVDEPISLASYIEVQEGDEIAEATDIDYDDDESREAFSYKDDSAEYGEDSYRIDILPSLTTDTYWLWDWTPRVRFDDDGFDSDTQEGNSLSDVIVQEPSLSELGSTMSNMDTIACTTVIGGDICTQFVLDDGATTGTAYHYFFDWDNDNQATLAATSSFESKTVYGEEILEFTITTELNSALAAYGYEDDAEEDKVRILSEYDGNLYAGEKEAADDDDLEGFYIYNSAANEEFLAQVETPVTFDEATGVTSSAQFTAMVDTYLAATGETLPSFTNLSENFEGFFQFWVYDEDTDTSTNYAFSEGNIVGYGQDYNDLASGSWSVESGAGGAYEVLSVFDSEDNLIALFVLFEDENSAGIPDDMNIYQDWYDIDLAIYLPESGEVLVQEQAVGFYEDGWRNVNSLSTCENTIGDNNSYSWDAFLAEASSCVEDNNPPSFADVLQFTGDDTSLTLKLGWFDTISPEDGISFNEQYTWEFNSTGDGVQTWSDQTSSEFTWAITTEGSTGLIINEMWNNNIVITDSKVIDGTTYYALMGMWENNYYDEDGEAVVEYGGFTQIAKLVEE